MANEKIIEELEMRFNLASEAGISDFYPEFKGYMDYVNSNKCTRPILEKLKQQGQTFDKKFSLIEEKAVSRLKPIRNELEEEIKNKGITGDKINKLFKEFDNIVAGEAIEYREGRKDVAESIYGRLLDIHSELNKKVGTIYLDTARGIMLPFHAEKNKYLDKRSASAWDAYDKIQIWLEIGKKHRKMSVNQIENIKAFLSRLHKFLLVEIPKRSWWEKYSTFISIMASTLPMAVVAAIAVLSWYSTATHIPAADLYYTQICPDEMDYVWGLENVTFTVIFENRGDAGTTIFVSNFKAFPSDKPFFDIYPNSNPELRILYIGVGDSKALRIPISRQHISESYNLKNISLVFKYFFTSEVKEEHMYWKIEDNVFNVSQNINENRWFSCLKNNSEMAINKKVGS